MKTATAKDIHNECDKQAEVLVKEAHSIIEKSQKRDSAIIAKIKKMGFTNSTSIKDDEKAVRFASNALRYKLLYPQNNFLTEEAIKKICEKYGLLFAQATDFIGEIPEKNQIEMANFKLADEDIPVSVIDKEKFKRAKGEIKIINRRLKTADNIFMQLIIGVQIAILKGSYQKTIYKKELIGADNYSLRKELNPEFCIIATPDNLSLEGKKIIGKYKVVDEDPVVFCKVDGGYLQISCWGDEASLDEFKNSNKN